MNCEIQLPQYFNYKNYTKFKAEIITTQKKKIM